MFTPEALKLLTFDELVAIADQLMIATGTDWDAFDQVQAEMKSRLPDMVRDFMSKENKQ